MKWDRLKLYNIVAQAKNITRASEILNLSQSSLSRQMKLLENEIGAKLFLRSQDGINLTKEGISLYNYVSNLSYNIDKIKDNIKGSENSPSGKLRVSATNAFGSLWVAPKMKKFKEQYPDIDIALNLRDSEPKVVHYESDVEIRMTPSSSQDDIQIKLADYRYKIFASKEYLKKFNTPNTIEDLDNQNIISYGDTAQPPLDRSRLNWLLFIGRDHNKPRKSILEVSSIYGIAKAAEIGMGIASLPDWMESDMISLKEVLPNLKGPALTISLSFKYELRNDSRIKVFKEFLLKEIKTIY
tara:strand:+ start:97 stop:990 length:894 start_codon:yes stop_codon:yes gene_type:complete